MLYEYKIFKTLTILLLNINILIILYIQYIQLTHNILIL